MKRFLPLVILPFLACSPLGSSGSESTSTNTTPSISINISKLEVAQTHVIPATGKTWAGTKMQNTKLHLVGQREALVLMDLTSSGTIQTPMLEAWKGNQKLGEVGLNPPANLPKTEVGGAPYSTTAYFAKLEAAWVVAGLEVSVRMGGQSSAKVAVKVGAPTEMNIYTLPFYLFGTKETDVPLSKSAMIPQANRDEYFAKHPISKLNIQNHNLEKIIWSEIIVGPRQGRAAQKVSYSEQQGDGFAVMSAVLNILRGIRSANGEENTNNQIYAPLLMANQAGKYVYPGGGLGGGSVTTGDHDYSGIFIHELGHGYGMPHAEDGFNNSEYPYAAGSLKGSSWGFDLQRNLFLSPFIPQTASSFKNCQSQRQLSASGQCIKQDPMQSGAGDQAKGDVYAMFSDFNAGVVQQYLEGTTTIKDGKRSFQNGKIIPDTKSSTGYSRWDSLDSAFVPVETKTVSNGIFGLDNNLPTQRNVDVQTILVSVSLSSITEKVDNTSLDYRDTLEYNPSTTYIYSPLAYKGNLRRTIDPSNAAELASIVPNTSQNSWYCLNSGCDYTLRVTFADSSQQLIAVQGGFRTWFGTNLDPKAGNPTDGTSYRLFAVNVSGAKKIGQIELLETPEVWKGLPNNPTVVVSRSFN